MYIMQRPPLQKEDSVSVDNAVQQFQEHKALILKTRKT